jgi:GDSL-like Lipase/Acylhydrolase family
VLVALGDSYMSGEGAATYFAGTDEGGGNGCRRAPTAWAVIAGQQSPRFDGVDFLACSGARTYHVRTDDDGTLPKPHAQKDEPGTQLGQYEQHRGRYIPEMVVLSLGGNDAGFGAIGRMCVAPGDCSEQQDLWLNGLDRVEENLRATYREVRDAFPGVPVVVVPYPDPLYDGDEAAAQGRRAAASRSAVRCAQVSLTAGERAFIEVFLHELNRRIHDAATDAELGFTYLAGMERALADAGLQLCDPLNAGRPGLSFIACAR